MSRADLLNSIVEYAYTKPGQELKVKLNHIIWKFKMTHPSGACAFMFKGQYYCEEGSTYKGRPPMLRGELVGPMEAWLKESKELADERDAAKNVIVCALTKATSKQDCLLLLPDCLHAPVQKSADFGHSTITKEEALAFIEQNKAHFDLIKKRLLLNMIC
jgi:hypothetical protein